MAAMAQVVRCSWPDSRLPLPRIQHSPAFAVARASTLCRAELKCSAPAAAERGPMLASRRIMWVSAVVALGLQLQQGASAKDIPLFGIKKRQAEKPVEPAPPVEKPAAEVPAKAEEIVTETKKPLSKFLIKKQPSTKKQVLTPSTKQQVSTPAASPSSSSSPAAPPSSSSSPPAASSSSSSSGIPLFGIKKRPQGQKPAEPAAAAVETKKQAPSFSSTPAAASSSSSPDSINPSLQAGAVVAAELLAVAVATSLVSGLVTSDSK